MIGTEAQFATKRCTPALGMLIARAVNFESYQGSVISEPVSVGIMCIGSKCAQWCWYDYADSNGYTHFASESMSRDYQRGRRDAPGIQTGVTVPARGYCGLTGSRE